MHFTKSLASLLFASAALASPVRETRAIAGRDLCTVGVPCVVQYEVNTALTATDEALALVQKDVKLILAPTGPVVIAVQASATILIKVAAELAAAVGPLVGSAKAELQAYVVAAIAEIISEIRAGVTVIAGVTTNVGATVSPQLKAATDAALSAIVAIETFVGPCEVPV